MHVLIAPSGFKESLAAEEVAEHLAAGVRRALPDATITTAPLADGGEGFARAIVAAAGGRVVPVRVTGPVGEPVDAHVGLLADGQTAVLEMAAAAGLSLVPRDLRDPLRTTTFGVGELVRAALDLGARRILVGCGDSGTNDGGAGLVQALGGRLLDAEGRDLPPGGEHLLRLDRLDLSGLDPRLADTVVDVACNPHNVLCGEQGVARVFGPQKGASPEQVERAAAAMDHWAAVLEATTGHDVRDLPGSGASGGLGSALHAVVGATLHPRFDVVFRYVDLDALLDEADLVLTAEGGIDFQTPRGKVPAEVARRAKARGLPVVCLAGTIGRRPAANLEAGIDAWASIVPEPLSLEEALERAPKLVRKAAEHAMRMVAVGRRLAVAEPLAA
jgi:glycerate 2-kinase